MIKPPVVVTVTEIKPVSVVERFIGAPVNETTKNMALATLREIRRKASAEGWTQQELADDEALSDVVSQCDAAIRRSQRADDEARKTIVERLREELFAARIRDWS